MQLVMYAYDCVVSLCTIGGSTTETIDLNDLDIVFSANLEIRTFSSEYDRHGLYIFFIYIRM